MKEARLYVDFNEMIEEDLVLLSQTDIKTDSEGKTIKLKEGLHIKIYSDDLNSCNEVDNLIANGIVELNTHGGWTSEVKWCCRIDSKGIYNESQE
ncbi:hypothetical protein [Saccharicrinis sp. 156]|uniref:hypothetical protein n=1 Tax=Saccharicrinis sp. 156 TaxID=3417574 RepID=UPI003D34C102